MPSSPGQSVHLKRTEVGKRIDAVTLPEFRVPKSPHSDIVKSMIGLLCQGKPDYDALEVFREVPFFRCSLGIGQCPSSPILRQRLDVVDGTFDRIVGVICRAYQRKFCRHGERYV